MDIARFPFIASCTLSSPNALDCKNECKMGSLHDNPRFHMLGASWYLSAAKTDGVSQEPHCETKAEPWAATNMCQDPGNSITDRFDRTHREVILTVAPCQLPPKECHFRMVLSQGSFPLLAVSVTELPTVSMTQTHSLSSSRDATRKSIHLHTTLMRHLAQHGVTSCHPQSPSETSWQQEKPD